MTDSELSALVADVVRRYGVPQLGEGEFTCASFAEAHGLTYNQASGIIRRAVADGGVVAVGWRMTAARHKAQAYRPAPGEIVCSK